MMATTKLAMNTTMTTTTLKMMTNTTMKTATTMVWRRWLAVAGGGRRGQQTRWWQELSVHIFFETGFWVLLVDDKGQGRQVGS
jgi:hypothetical protein